ncbi:hypothetical protein HDU93_001048, partial [Gonapodya sp. JEL0774]
MASSPTRTPYTRSLSSLDCRNAELDGIIASTPTKLVDLGRNGPPIGGQWRECDGR